MAAPDRTMEWLEADGLGGFASGTAAGIRTRRYHALLLAAADPPAGRYVLVNGVEVHVLTSRGEQALSSHLYVGDVVHPDGSSRIRAFGADPWPRWEYHLEDGTRVDFEIFVPNGRPAVVLRWRAAERGASPGPLRLTVRPLLSGRDPHALHRENPAFRFDAEPVSGGVRWRPYEGVPAVRATGNGAYEHAPDWYRSFLYEEERARGLDFVEDLASPGAFHFDLTSGDAVLVLAAESTALDAVARETGGAASADGLRASEMDRRRRFPTPLHRAADAYLVRRGSGRTIIAGYPWFGDWGRDTFIALRGLCLATGRLEEAGSILGEWAGAVSEGMLPNRFPDAGGAPEYNSVDASLWYVVAVHEYLKAREDTGSPAGDRERRLLLGAAEAILDGYSRGTRYGIRMDADGLLAAGVAGAQLTWMDAKVGDWVVTPRSGKPVEVQALWINALRIGSASDPRWGGPLARATTSFATRFWNEDGGCLHDVVDVDHRPGTADASLRPNQIFAVGGLPWPLLEGDRARRVVDVVERDLLTPLGLRSLAPGQHGYTPRYEGGVRERDGAYHQGTVWPWLIGAFVEAWVRVRGGTAEARREARTRFLDLLLRHLDEAGLGHVSEIADAEPPHTPRGCPFQAWSVGEALRLDRVVLAGAAAALPRGPRRRTAAPRSAAGRARA